MAQDNDWEPEDEVEPPDPLKDKWFRDELSFKDAVECPACRRQQPKENLSCLFCGARIFEYSGLLGSILAHIRRLFR